MVLLRQVQGQPPPAGVREVYPNRYAGGKYKRLGYSEHEEGVETHGMKCAQCGYPLKDTRKVVNCPNCGSDNFEGEKLNL